MKNKIGWMIMALLCLVSGGAQAKEVVKIGVIGPLSGNVSMIGEDMQKGILLAADELKGKVELKFVFEDDQFESRRTNAAALKLIQVDKVDVIISLWDVAANVISQHTDKYKVIQFNTGWNPTVIAKYKWILCHGGDYREFTRQYVEIMKAHGAKRLAIISPLNIASKHAVEAAKPLLKDAGIEIVFHQPYAPGIRDFRTYILKVRETNPDFVWNLNLSPEDEIIFKTMHELGIKWPSTGAYWETKPELYRFLEGDIFPTIDTSEEFNEKFKAKYGRLSNIVEAGYCYDIVHIISRAVEELYAKTGKMPTREELLVELRRPRELEGLSVGTGIMHAEGWVETPYIFQKIEGGKRVPSSLKEALESSAK